MTILPTHSCFDDAMEIIVDMLAENTLTSDVVLVHGIIAPDGVDIAHAWLEQGETGVIFAGIIDGEKVICKCDLDEWYQQSIVKDKTTYTLEEAAAEEVRCGHCAPWLERYEALCRKGEI